MQSGVTNSLAPLISRKRVRPDLASLEGVLKEGIASATQKYINRIGDDQSIEAFLTSPQAETVVRQIFGVLLSPSGSDLKGSLQASLVEHLQSHGLPNSDSEAKADALYELLEQSCLVALRSQLRSRGDLTVNVQDAIVAHSFRRVHAQLKSIEASLEAVRTFEHRNLIAEVEFEKQYRILMRGHHGTITPQSIQRVDKVPIDELYVPSDLYTTTDKSRFERFTVATLLRSGFRSVILGVPGGGKSTLGDKLCYELAQLENASRQSYLPIHVTLRDYASQVSRRDLSLLDFVEQTTRTRFSLDVPVGFFGVACAAGRAFVCFDGLDELLDPTFKREISVRIEAFSRLYPAMPILVTSREVGYEDAPLDQGSFELFRLASFDERQTREYCNKWFSALPNLSDSELSVKVDAFMYESGVAQDLRENPLMLSLMCTLYHEEGYIPRNRPEVYDKCANLLFDRWDRRRGIRVALPFDAQVDPAMKHLAFWIYSEQKRQSGVTEAEIITEASRYLRQKLYEDDDEANFAARSFVEYCRGRAWVFTDVGTTPTGEHLYGFTHRTFLEYFSACHLVRTGRTADSLAETILPRVLEGQWEVVAEMSVQLLAKQLDGAADEIVELIVARFGVVSEVGEHRLAIFLLRCLQFITPTPTVVRVAVQVLFRWARARRVIDTKFFEIAQRATYSYGSRPLEYFAAESGRIAKESRVVYQRSLSALIIEVVAESEDQLPVMAEFLYMLGSARAGFQTRESQDAWKDWVCEEASKMSGLVRLYTPKNLVLAQLAVLLGTLSLKEFLKTHRLKGLLEMQEFLSDGSRHWPPLIVSILRQMVFGGPGTLCGGYSYDDLQVVFEAIFRRIEIGRVSGLKRIMMLGYFYPESPNMSVTLIEEIRIGLRSERAFGGFVSAAAIAYSNEYPIWNEGRQIFGPLAPLLTAIVNNDRDGVALATKQLELPEVMEVFMGSLMRVRSRK